MNRGVVSDLDSAPRRNLPAAAGTNRSEAVGYHHRNRVPAAADRGGESELMVRQRVRIRFCKQGDLRWIGHRDLMRCLERVFRRAGLALSMSQGFHPKPRMTFPLALAVGIEGIDEVMELELAETVTAETARRRLAPQVPPGLTLNSVEVLPDGTKKARVHTVTYRVPVPAQSCQGLSETVDHVLAGSSCLVHRDDRSTPVDLRPLLKEVTLCDGVLQMRLRVGQQGGARPREVLAALGLRDLEFQGVHLTRTHVEIQP